MEAGGNMDARTLGLLMVLAGMLLAVIGGAIAIGALSWFGRLPGDLRYESDHVRVYVPIVSMLLLSVAVSFVLFIAGRLR
jgi:hypothetical protein